ncbi:MAG: molecular chaperone DnaK, partial [Thermoleophilaceae bacterium]
AERQLKEMGDSVDSASKEQIEAAIKDIRDSLESEDAALLNAKTAALQEAFHKVSEQMYAAAAQAQQAGAPDGGAGSANGDDAAGTEEEVVDAEVVDGERDQ